MKFKLVKFDESNDKIKTTTSLVFTGIILIALLIFIVLAITRFTEHGGGIGYYLSILFPLITILFSIIAVQFINKWYIIPIIIFSSSELFMLYNSLAITPYPFIYTVLSIIICINQKVLR